MKDRKQSKILYKISNLNEIGIIIFLVVIIAAVSIRNPIFLTLDNIHDISLDVAILAIVAVGEMLVILTGGIDISLGSGIGLSGMVVALLLMNNPAIPPIVAILMGGIFGAVLGVINGALIVKVKIPPIITTLGTMSIFRGLTFVVNYIVNQGKWVGADKFSDPFKTFTRDTVFLVPNLVLIAIIVYIIAFFFLNHTITGRNLYAAGSNPDAAKFAGINLEKMCFLPYLISGLLVGICGVLWVSRYTSAQTDSAQGFEFMAITAVVIGGVKSTGGSGSIIGVLFGAILIGVINNSLNIIHVSPFWKLAINGAIILSAIITDKLISERVNKSLLKEIK